MRKTTRWFLAGASVLVLAGCGTTAAVSQSPPPASPAATAPATKAPAPVKESTYNLAIGKTVTITDDYSGSSWSVTVNSAKRWTPGEYDSPARAGQHYVVINVTYVALKGQANPNPFDWETKIASGQTFDEYATAGQTELSSNSITAPSRTTGDVVLVVPDNTPATAVYSLMSEHASWVLPAS